MTNIKWEYLRLDIDDGSNPIDWLNLGKQGWELVTIYRGFCYFKRQVRNISNPVITRIINNEYTKE